MVVRARRSGSGATAPRVEQGLGECWTDGPEAAGPAEPVGTLRAGESCGSAEGHGGKVRRAGDANMLVRFRYSALRGGYVRSSLQQLRRGADRSACRLILVRRRS